MMGTYTHKWLMCILQGSTASLDMDTHQLHDVMSDLETIRQALVLPISKLIDSPSVQNSKTNRLVLNGWQTTTHEYVKTEFPFDRWYPKTPIVFEHPLEHSTISFLITFIHFFISFPRPCSHCSPKKLLLLPFSLVSSLTSPMSTSHIFTYILTPCTSLSCTSLSFSISIPHFP